MYSVDIINSLERFVDCQQNWNEIYQRDSEADYFMSWDWLYRLISSRDEGVFVLAVCSPLSSYRYCAFLPLRQQVRYSNSTRSFFTSYCMTGNYWADSTGMICDPALDEVSIRSLAAALKSLPWQRLLFESLNMSTHRLSMLMEQFPDKRFKISAREHTDNKGTTDLACRPYVDLPESFDQYLEQNLSANTRQKLRRSLRKLDTIKELSIAETCADDLDEHIEFFERVWIENWSELKGSSTRQLARKYSEFLRSGFLSGDMLITVLLHHSVPVALVACYQDDIKKQLLFFVAGRDSTFELLPSGLLLHAYCIQRAIEKNYHTYELLRGNEPYKYSLGATDSHLSNIVIFDREPIAAARLLPEAGKYPALRLVDKLSREQSDDQTHELFAQLLESWPNDADVLSQYAVWLGKNRNTQHVQHALTIQDYLEHHSQAQTESISSARQSDTINIAPFQKIQHWLNELDCATQALDHSGCLHVEHLQLNVFSDEPEHFLWLEKYLYPLATSGDKTANETTECIDGDGDSLQLESAHHRENFKLSCVTCSDSIISLSQLMRTENIGVMSIDIDGRAFKRLSLTSSITLDLYKQNGVAWVCDSKNRHVTLLMSSRTTWPSLEVSRTARAILIGYLQQEGWLFLHSGAIRIEESNYLVIGDEGQGKTSLILALMSAGCAYISNERVFVRKTRSGIEARSFPMPIAIGMGTAQQYPGVMHYVQHSEDALYPARRMDPENIKNTPDALLHTLKDKVQLLAGELEVSMNASESLCGGSIAGVIVPSVVKNAAADYQDNAKILSTKKRQRIVHRNYIASDRDGRYSAWLPLDFKPLSRRGIHDTLASIDALPAVLLNYYATKDRQSDVARYPTLIRDSLP